MKRFKVVITESAYDDLDRITDYLIEKNPTAAFNTYERIISAYRQLEIFPLSGPSVSDIVLRANGYRKLVVDDYISFYRFFDDTCVIYHIFNAKQDYRACMQPWLQSE